MTMQDTEITEGTTSSNRQETTPSTHHGMSRRTLLKVAGASAGVAALASPLFSNIAGEAASTFYKGADISWAPQMEANGYYFNNPQGVRQDILTILKGFGINAIRLRTFVHPSNSPQNGHCSQSETIAMIKRCKAAGMSVDLDFMFGDTWNSVGGQTPPAAWAKMSYTEMLAAMHTYVSGFMLAMKAANVAPTWVQIGNEENSGICHPVGALSSHPTQLTGLLNTAYAAIKTTFPSAQVIVHLAQPQKLPSIENFLDTYKKLGGKWDVTGFSSYGSGAVISTIVANMAAMQSRYGKPTIQVEFGGQVSQPAKVEKDLTTYLQGIKKYGGLGLFYWEPEGYSPFTNYDLTAWDSKTRRPTTALNGFASV